MNENTIFVFDLDGTLIETGEKLNKSLTKILTKLVHQSRVLIATARHPLGVQYVFEPNFDFIPTISLNGAGLHLKNWCTFDKSISFPEKTVLRLYEKFSENNITATFYGKEFWAVNKITSSIEREANVTGMIPLLWENHYAESILKILAIDDVEKIRGIRSQISLEFPGMIQMSSSFDKYLEISPSGVFKCLFLPEFINSYLMKERKKEKPNILFFGDSENDIQCAKVADATWTFESSPEELKALSKGILQDKSYEGVRKFLQKNL